MKGKMIGNKRKHNTHLVELYIRPGAETFIVCDLDCPKKRRDFYTWGKLEGR